MTWKIRFVLPVLIATWGCSSLPPNRVEQVREGMDKAQVLEQAGSPKRTFRTNSQDHWVYVFFRKDEEFSQQISFEDGKVVQIARATAKQNWGREIENMKNPDAGFKAIDGGPDDVNKPE